MEKPTDDEINELDRLQKEFGGVKQEVEKEIRETKVKLDEEWQK